MTSAAIFTALNLDEGTLANACVVLQEQPNITQIALHGNANDPLFVSTVAHILQIKCPIVPNNVCENSQSALLATAPHEWLLLAEAGQEQRLLFQLRDGLGDQEFSIADLSGGQTIISIGGKYAAEVLAKGCNLDFHPDIFAQNRCAQTIFSDVNAMVHRGAVEKQFNIIVRRSGAGYLWTWLQDAAKEFAPLMLARELNY